MKILTNYDFGQNQILNGVWQKLATAPASPVEGQKYYNTATHREYVYNGTDWTANDAIGATMTGANIVTSINGSASIIDLDNLPSTVGTAVTNNHTHANKAILDAITASFLSADRTKLDGIEAGAQSLSQTNLLNGMNGASTRTTIADTDTMNFIYNGSGLFSKITWANIKVVLKAYTDTLYNNYSLPIATASVLGGVKSGTDITVDASGNVSVNDNSHAHTTANVTGLDTALGLKAPLASPAFTGTPTAPTLATTDNTTSLATTAFAHALFNTLTTITGNAGTASKWFSARTISFATGDVTGSFSIDGSADVSNVALTVADDSHNHVISNVDGLQTALDGKTPFSTLNATTSATAGWYRIATSAVNIGANSGLIKVDFAGTGVKGSALFRASCHDGVATGSAINQLGFTTTAGTLGLTKVRVVYHTTYTANYAYIEVYNPTALAITYTVDLIDTTGWTLLTPSTVGSIPSGYTSEELTLDIGVVSMEDVTAGGQLRSNIATGTAPLVVASTTLVSNLNAQYLNGQASSYYAPLASPTFTGTPAVPTATAGTNTTQIASTAFVTTAVANKTSVTGNAGTATKLAVARTVTFGAGDVTGSFTFDGNSDVTGVVLTVADDSHNHIIANVDGLQTALDGKETPTGAQSKADTALNSAKAYADQVKADIIGGSQATLDTLYEFQQAINSDPNFSTTMLNLIGAKTGKYATTVGDGTNTVYTITHNLNTQNASVALRESASPYALVYTDIEMTTVNTLTVKFAVAPTSGQYTLTVIG